MKNTAAFPAPDDAPEGEVLHWLPLDRITVLPQVRKVFDAEMIEALAANIREFGIQQPLLCQERNGEIVLLDGECRLRAAPLADLRRVPVRMITDSLTAADVLARQLSCNLQRLDLNLVERAEGFRQFMSDADLTAEQAAVKLGLSPTSVCKTLAVLRLPQSLQKCAASGALSAEAAYLLVRVADADRQAELASKVIAGELNRENLAAAVRSSEVASRASTPAASQPESAKPVRAKSSVWRMTRTIGIGVALAVTGTGLTLEELVALLEGFAIRAREAIARNVPVAKFLSEFRYDAAAAATKGVTP